MDAQAQCCSIGSHKASPDISEHLREHPLRTYIDETPPVIPIVKVTLSLQSDYWVHNTLCYSSQVMIETEQMVLALS
jgi:hypothetical protein